MRQIAFELKNFLECNNPCDLAQMKDRPSAARGRFAPDRPRRFAIRRRVSVPALRKLPLQH